MLGARAGSDECKIAKTISPSERILNICESRSSCCEGDIAISSMVQSSTSKPDLQFDVAQELTPFGTQELQASDCPFNAMQGNA